MIVLQYCTCLYLGLIRGTVSFPIDEISEQLMIKIVIIEYILIRLVDLILRRLSYPSYRLVVGSLQLGSRHQPRRVGEDLIDLENGRGLHGRERVFSRSNSSFITPFLNNIISLGFVIFVVVYQGITELG